jgi:hypothetical protein
MSMRLAVCLGLSLAVSATVGGTAGAQKQPATPAKGTPCPFKFQADRFSTDTVPGGAQVTFAAGNVVIRCAPRGIVVRGDSLERRPDGEHMIGHAVYDEPRFHVTADFLNYLSTIERVVAVGNVHARLPSGSTMDGPVAEWNRTTPTRPQEEMIARSRPTIKIVQKDTATKRPPGAKPGAEDTTTIVAKTVHTLGDTLIYAGGSVVITRTDISATADSAFVDQPHETMRLMQQPTLSGKKERPFTLKGDLIDLYSKNRKLERVIARSNAVATSDSMTLRADTIDLRVKNDLLDHAYAWGKLTHARATSPSQNVLADSLDVTMPGQKVRLMRALGNAFAQGKPDTARFVVEKPDTTDWLKGDTITAHFDTTATKDTSKTPNIRQLFALGRASSWYHLPASDSAEKRPMINEVSAKRITIDFDKQKVATVTAIDSVVGVMIEPKPDTAAKRTNAANAANAAGKAPAKTTPGTGVPPKTPPKTPVKPPAKPADAPLLNSSPTKAP